MTNSIHQTALLVEKINVLQEAGAREIDTKELESITKEIEQLYKSVSSESKAAVANSLGLAYRRLGERGNTAVLKQALAVFENGIPSATDTILVELHSNMAITYIRLFEFKKDEEYLNKAEASLNECVRLLENQEGQVLKASVYNNAGNLWKQYYTSSQDPLDAEKALQYYALAEGFSSEKDAPYFWATIQKNKGEVKYFLSKTDKDPTRILEGVLHCLDSLQYRDRVSAPYQWLKSVEVLFDLVLLSPENFIKESEYKERIVTVVTEFTLVEHTLEQANYKSFKEKSQQVKGILQIFL
jgi:tetratricopeptide (TPR) repeat protein